MAPEPHHELPVSLICRPRNERDCRLTTTVPVTGDGPFFREERPLCHRFPDLCQIVKCSPPGLARWTLPSDQAAFRIDWSKFLAGQSDRTRCTLAMLAACYMQTEVADRLNVTPPAICQRINKARREWQNFQEAEVEDTSRTPAAGHA